MFTLKKKPLNCASIERFLRLHHFLFNNVFFLPNLGDLGMIINLACEIWIPGSAAFVRGAFRMPQQNGEGVQDPFSSSLFA